MNQLVFIQNNQPVTDSLTIADMFGKEHKNVLRDINVQVQYAGPEFSQLNFEQSEYEIRGKRYPKFNLTEEAFALVVFGYNTKAAVQTKIKFIQEFKRMKEHIQNNVVPLSKDQALVTVLRTTADLVENYDSVVKEQHELRKLVTQVDQKVEEQITLDHGEQRRLQKAVAAKVYEICSDPEQRPSLFREIYREIKDRFAVASYKDVKRKELQSAIRYVENWIPRRVS